MNINSLFTASGRLASTDTNTTSFAMNNLGIGRIAAMTAMKRDPEVVAASALTSLLNSENVCKPLTYQHYWHRQHEQARVTSDARKLQLPERFTKNGRRRAVPFPLKLMQVLSEEQYAHIITWMPNGRSFVILRPKAFVSDILPRHFKSAQYASFTRKLARWGFLRCEDGTGEFYHPQFRKGRIDLAEKMTCLGPASSAKSLHLKASRNTTNDALLPNRGDDYQEVSSIEDSEVVIKANDKTSNNQVDRFETSLPIGDNLGIFNKDGHNNMLAIEMEASRLRRCIHAAALSRKALADLRRDQFASLLSKHKTVDSMAIAGIPKIQNPFLLPWGSAMLSSTVHSRRIPTRVEGTSDFRPPFQFLGVPNIKGAKSA